MSPGAIRGSPAAGMSDRQRHPTRGLTEGAILAALTVIVAAVGLVAPFVGVLLAPLPIMLLVIRWGLRIGVLASVVAAVLLLQFFGPVTAAPIVAAFVPLGLALGWGVRRGFAAHLTILAGAAAFLLATIAALGVFAAALHLDPIAQLIQIQVRASQITTTLLQRLGLPFDMIEQIRLQWESFCAEHQCFNALMPPLVRPLFPLILVSGALISAYLCYTVARTLLRRVGHELSAVPPLLAWRVNPLLASALVWSAAGSILLSYLFPAAAVAAFNAAYAILFVFTFQGALVGVTWMNRWGIPWIAQAMAVILLLQVLVILGLLDTWFDFRRLEGLRAPIPPSAKPSDKERDSSARAPAPKVPVSQPVARRAAAGQARSAAAQKPSRQTGNRVKVVRPS